MLNRIYEIELIICIKMDLALNNLQRLICHKTQIPKQQVLNQFFAFLSFYSLICWNNEVYQFFCVNSKQICSSFWYCRISFYLKISHNFVGFIYTIHMNGQNLVACTVLSKSRSPPSRALFWLFRRQFSAFAYHVVECFFSLSFTLSVCLSFST